MKVVTYASQDWPHGLRCAECEREFAEGQPIRTVPLSMFDDGTPVEMVVCGACELDAALNTDQARDEFVRWDSDGLCPDAQNTESVPKEGA